MKTYLQFQKFSNDSLDRSEYQMTLKNLYESLKIELRSVYCRLFFIQKKPRLKIDNNNLLNLGSGTKKLEGWINSDFFIPLKPWKKNENKPDWMLDLRFPLRCDDNIWDGVFSEHTLEHLYPIQVLNLLKELNRTMKPGAWLRITVPDLKQYVNYYCGQAVDETFYQWSSGCEAIRDLTQNHRHSSLWDAQLLSRFLKESNFINIKEVSFRQGTDERLLQDGENRKWETLYMEAQKTHQ